MDKIVELLQYIAPKTPINKGKFMGNYKCHVNSLSYALKHSKNVKCIVGCLQVFNDSSGVAHFVVKLNNGDLIDPTYGRVSSTMYAYLLPLQEYEVTTFSPNRELTNLKDHLHNQLPWLHRMFTSAKRM